MSKTKSVPKPAPLTDKQILTALLEFTGDLDTAQVLQESLPPGLLKTSSATLEALDRTTRELHASQALVEADLRKLKPLNAFCIAEMNNALAGKWPGVFDVKKDYLELPGEECGCEPTRSSVSGKPATAPATRTLLEAAMQNFTEEEAGDDGFPEGSVVRVGSTPEGIAGLSPATFAAFCRDLNLGQRYQQHFQQVFGLRDVDGTVASTSPMTSNIVRLKKQQLQLDLHLALVKGHISQTSFECVQALIDAEGVAGPKTLHYGDLPLIMQGIEMLDCCVWGVVVFSARSVELYPDEWCLVYMPGEPQQPLYEYRSFTAFVEYLGFKLGLSSYKRYFSPLILEDDKAGFFKSFGVAGSLGHVKQLPIKESLFQFMFNSHVGKLQLDARSLAVPTADVDEEVRKKRLLNYLETGMTVATIAGFFVPVLGQLMMGVAVGQLLAEVYEGVEDWSNGDRQEALAHMLSVAENIGLMAATGVGQNALKSLAIKTVRKHPEFFGQFAAIVDRSDKSRLWKPELGTYRQPLPSGTSVTPDDAGLFQVSGKTFVRMDYGDYAVAKDPVSKAWRIQHPARQQAYAPVLERNTRGGWRHSAERSEQWAGTYTLKRIDPRLTDIEDHRLDMIRRLTDTAIDELHRVSDDNLPLPARLNDTLERFGLERRVRDFITEMERGEVVGTRHVQEQLYSLPKLPGWPTDRYIKVVDEQARITATYPPTSQDDDSLSVIVSQEQLGKGELLPTLINGLYEKEVEVLLGAKVPKAEQTVQLAKKLGVAVKADRRSVFDHLYQGYDQSSASDVQKVRTLYPDIPARYAQALIDRAPSVERLRMRANGRVPMGLAQNVREASSAVRMDRALSGFYLPHIANADTEKLAIQLLPRLSGWDANLRLELRDQTLTGRLLETIGEQPATRLNSCTLVKLKVGYEAFDGDGKSLGQVAMGPDSLYEAILKVLTASQRKAMGFLESKPDDSSRLRSKLLQSALDQREASAQVLVTGKFEPEPSKAACMQADSSAEKSTHTRALLRKVKKLYPLFSDAQANAFLDDLGGDHLTRATRVKQLQRDLDQLCDVLEGWSTDEAGMKAAGGVLSEVKNSRQTAAYVIEDSFRRQIFMPDEHGKPQCGLKLDGMRVGKMPILPLGLHFDHVKQLSLKNMEQGNDLAYFLKAFRQVESLELDSNKLSLLPEVISLMPALIRLSLAGNQIQLTESTSLKLANLRTLQTLNLSDNPLGDVPDVSKMFDLRYFSMRNTRAKELPKGLQRLLNLDRVDLRDNDIQVLPDWLFRMPKRFTETLNVRNNPLSATSITQLKGYRDRLGMGLGYLENDIARLDEQQARSLWLTETEGKVGRPRQRIWTALKDEPAAEGLFHLLAELGNTADSHYVREDMSRRVWEVLEAAEADATLREQLLDLAANPINCTDSAALNFSHLEVAVEVQKVTRPTGARRGTAASLLKLGRGLFQLEQLDKIAAEHAAKNRTLDPLEVCLAYRTGLADDFDLPGQPRHMRHASLSGVTEADLETAMFRVKTAELSPLWLKFLARQSFWCNYLESLHAQRFDDNDQRFQTEMEELFEKREKLISAEYQSISMSILSRRASSRNALIEELTQEAMRRDELGICVLSDR